MSIHSTELIDFLDQGGAERQRSQVLRAVDPVRTDHEVSSGFYARVLKRPLDIVLVLATAPLWLPFMLLAALAISLDGHNPFYRQQRVGQNGRVFTMLKLRTMVPGADARLEDYLARNPEARAEWDSTQKLKNDPRVTTVGRILRKTSLDELPQLINVLTGEMSLIGPRPMMVSQRHLYEGAGYYMVRPGLTGFWQISDRNECGFQERAMFDDAYARSASFLVDMIVLRRTVSVVLRGTGY